MAHKIPGLLLLCFLLVEYKKKGCLVKQTTLLNQ
jgi:hypothetical protein